MRVDNLAAFQAGREYDKKERPEVRQVKQPEAEPVSTSQRAVRFQKHQNAGRWMIQVVDLGSNEVIREIPDQKRLDMAAAMKNLVGSLQDVKC